MKVEIPVFKRCCFCLPLRYGLLGWGYFKMTADVLLITYLSLSMIKNAMMLVSSTDNNYLSQIIEGLILPMIADAVFIVDFVATILFIVGGHKKNIKLMRVFYIKSIAMFIFTLILTATAVVLTIQNFILRDMHFWERTMLMFSFYFLVLAVQTYFLILLRSEIMKLRAKSEFRFMSNATQAKCTMKCEEIRAEEETNKEGV